MPRGGARTGAGRPKGSPSKRTWELAELMAAEVPGYDPVVAMARIATDPDTPLDLKLRAHAEIAPFLRSYPLHDKGRYTSRCAGRKARLCNSTIATQCAASFDSRLRFAADSPSHSCIA